jgi:xylan 1,4-beta-xylosidase
VVKQPFYGGFGLIAEYGLPKPSFNAFKLLHRLGENRIPVDTNSAIVTRRGDGTLVVAVWNLFLPEENGRSKNVAVVFRGLEGRHRAVIYRVDSTHGSLTATYDNLGRPQYPTQVQISQLRRAAEIPAPESKTLQHGAITIPLPPQGLALIEIR